MDYFNPMPGQMLQQGLASFGQSIGNGMNQMYQNRVQQDAILDARNERAKQQQSLGKGAEAIANGLGDTFYSATGLTPDEFKAMGSLDKYQVVKGFSDSQAIKKYTQEMALVQQQQQAGANFQQQIPGYLQPAPTADPNTAFQPRAISPQDLLRIGAQTGALATPQFNAAASMAEKMRPLPQLQTQQGPDGSTVYTYGTKMHVQPGADGSAAVVPQGTTVNGVPVIYNPKGGNFQIPPASPDNTPPTFYDVPGIPGVKVAKDKNGTIHTIQPPKHAADEDPGTTVAKTILGSLQQAKLLGTKNVIIGSDGKVTTDPRFSMGRGTIEPIDAAIQRFQSALKPQAEASPSADGQPVRVNTKAERDALPAGAKYIGPDGKTYQKK